MAGQKSKLTKRTVDAACPETRRYAVLDTEIPGFRLYVLHCRRDDLSGQEVRGNR